MLAAARGGDPQALFDDALRNGRERGEGAALALPSWLIALSHNSRGQYGEALAAGRQACEREDVMAYNWARAELIEAGIRSGAPDEAAAALGNLSERTQASATQWALGIEARCGALVNDDDSQYRESVRRFASSRARLELARSRLLYVEWLRRENRRSDAREQLRAAHEDFRPMGAAAFAERASRELLATGETVRRITPQTRDALTPQEIQIARLARDGHTYPEIGAQLYISPHTVEYDLRKVFRKLDVSTRRELRGALGGTADQSGLQSV